MTHPWRSSGSKRTIWWYCDPSDQVMAYLKDMRDAIRYGIFVADHMRRRDGHIPSSIDLRREIKPWFDSRYAYAKHHVNPVCRSSVAILRSFLKNGNGKRFPEVKKLSMRLDSELVKTVNNSLRITIRPGEYEFIPLNGKNRKWNEYCRYKISEVLITDRIVSISFTVQEHKQLAGTVMGMDINFNTIDTTAMDVNTRDMTSVETKSVANIVGIQNDFSRRRRKIQKNVRNPEKRNRKLRRTRGRQRNRIRDALHKLSTKTVEEHPDASFILEDLSNIRKTASPESRKLRTYLNRWPYSEFQKMLEYKSKNRTVYVNPGGTSSRCPVCGGKLKHPAWKISRCYSCDRDYDRDRLASLAISLRGLYLCGDPFTVSALASLPSMMDEYLYVRNRPEIPEAGPTEMVYAANRTGA